MLAYAAMTKHTLDALEGEEETTLPEGAHLCDVRPKQQPDASSFIFNQACLSSRIRPHDVCCYNCLACPCSSSQMRGTSVITLPFESDMKTQGEATYSAHQRLPQGISIEPLLTFAREKALDDARHIIALLLQLILGLWLLGLCSTEYTTCLGMIMQACGKCRAQHHLYRLDLDRLWWLL